MTQGSEKYISECRRILKEAQEHLALGEHSECGGSCREEISTFIAEVEEELRKALLPSAEDESRTPPTSDAIQ